MFPEKINYLVFLLGEEVEELSLASKAKIHDIT